MLDNIKNHTVIKCNNLKEKKILIDYLESNNIRNGSLKDTHEKFYCTIYTKDKLPYVFNFLYTNPDSSYNIIQYSDIIKSNPLNLLESKLKELFSREDISFYISFDNIEEVNKLNKLLVLLDEKWVSQTSFDKKHISNMLETRHHYLSKIKKIDGVVGFMLTSKVINNNKIIYIKDILKEIGLEELNKKQ